MIKHGICLCRILFYNLIVFQKLIEIFYSKKKSYRLYFKLLYKKLGLMRVKKLLDFLYSYINIKHTRMKNFSNTVSKVVIFFEVLRNGSKVSCMFSPVWAKIIQPSCVWSPWCEERCSARTTDSLLGIEYNNLTSKHTITNIKSTL